MEFHNKPLNRVYAETLNELIEANPAVYCLEADLARASMAVPLVKEKHPGHYVNVGVCEANMMGVGAGMAREGKIPFCATFTAFAARRACDQVAISVAYANTNVKVIGMEPGHTSGPNGGTHMCFEDIAIMRALPNMHVYSPADVYELQSMMRHMAANDQPTYMQLLRISPGVLFDDSYTFEPGKLVRISEGNDVTLVSLGFMSNLARAAQEQLEKQGIGVDLLHCPCVKPFDRDKLLASAEKTGAVVTVESQNILGGLGSAVCEALTEHCPLPAKRLGIPDSFGEVIASFDYLMEKHGYGIGSMVDACKAVMHGKRATAV